jgi:hypothetical protein
MYIVWNNYYESYSRPQGDGYYVGYKDKLSDKFSTSIFGKDFKK